MSRGGSRCGEARARLVLLLAGEIDPGERRAAEAHLESCAACRREAEGIGSTLRALALDGREVPDPGPAYWGSFNERLGARIRLEARARRRALLAAAAALVFAAGAGALAYRAIRSGAGGPPPPVAAAGRQGAEAAEARLELLLRRAAAHEEGLRAAQAALDEMLPGADALEGAGAL